MNIFVLRIGCISSIKLIKIIVLSSKYDKYAFPLDSVNFHLFFLKYMYDDFFNGFIEKLQGEISSFLTEMAFRYIR